MNHREPPPTTLHCRHEGCSDSTRVMLRHVENLTASGGWTCWRPHDGNAFGALAEVTC